MNPADLTLPTISPTLSAKTLATSHPSAQKNSSTGKVPVSRVELEPIYTQLKAALGADQWAEYKAALNAFVLGNLNQAELSWVLQPLLSSSHSVITTADPLRSPVSTQHLHNTLLAVLYANTLRDPPSSDVAPWVVASDKPTATSKNAGVTGANDKAEERLKRETVSLHARDRRRIKVLKEDGRALNDGLREIQDYKHELAVKPPDVVPQSAGGLQKTNWDLEMRRRYAQRLAAETLEFPTQGDMQDRIEPICAEEGLVPGTQSTMSACAELVEQATEVYLKELLSQLCAHARSNAEGCVQTTKFRRQLQKEEAGVERAIIQRNAAGLLPVEMEVQAKREPLNMQDMRLALQLSDPYLDQDHFLEESILLSRYPDLALTSARVVGATPGAMFNGSLVEGEQSAMDDVMAIDGIDFWKGASRGETDELMGVLDDCLAVG